ncbi:MAG: hypothetical protein VX864_01240 [Pseudomonadota bacterium]|nr:hypothetical protein [Pseudomonadota bacterium]
MNKDLPEPIKKIFKDPDPLIWQGVWLETLKKLLSHKKMIWVWEMIIKLVQDRYDGSINMPLEQFLKWETKAFVARTIKLSNETNTFKDFQTCFQIYFSNKNIKIPDRVIDIVYEVVNDK